MSAKPTLVPTSDSSPQPATTTTEVVTPATVLDQLAKYISGNPFATDRKSVMVAAKGRELTTVLNRAAALKAEAAKLESSCGTLVADSIAILNGTHPGLKAGTTAGK